MATIKNLDKGGIIVRLSSKAIGYIWGCDDIENQEYIKYYIGGNKFTEEYTINPPFTINSNYLEIKIPYDTIKYITSDISNTFIINY